MATVEDIRLPSPQQSCENEYLVTPERVDSSKADLPSVNTDDLPITPVRNKKWLNNSVLSDLDLSTEGLSSNYTSESPEKLQNSVEKASPLCSRENSPCLPNTDNLLDITAPRPTLLGREQAKKRLHAFSLTKQNNLCVSPLSKKNMRQSKFLLQPAEDIYDENGEKTDEKFILVKKPNRKNLNPNEKAKAVIEEIEKIKKIENAYLEGLLSQKTRRSKTRSKSKEQNSRRNYKRSRSRDRSKSGRSLERLKYPKSWTEIKTKGYSLEMLTQMKGKQHTRGLNNECSDFRKQLLFQIPSLPLHKLSIKTVNGKERTVPFEYLRYTNRNPKISYSIQENIPNDLYSRKTVLKYIPKSFCENIKKITDMFTPPQDLNSSSKITTRPWFPKAALTKLGNSNECTILENSLGLSFLQNYSEDGDDQLKNDEMKVSFGTNDANDGKSFKLKKTDSNSNLEEKISNSDIKGDKHKSKYKRKKRSKEKKRKEKQKHKTSVKDETVEKKSKRSTTNESKGSACDNQQKDKIQKDQDKTIEQIEKYHQLYENKGIASTLKDSDIQENKSHRSTEEELSLRENTQTEIIEKESLPKNTLIASVEPHISQSDLDDRQNKEDEKHPKEMKIKDKQKSNSPSNKKSEKNIKKQKLEKKLEETRKVKCVAETEFGTPDTDEYYSNWESDTSLEKPSTFMDMNTAWETDEESESRFESVRNRPLGKYHFKEKDLSGKGKSPEKIKKFSLKDDSLHLNNLPLETTLKQNEFSPFRNRMDEQKCSRHLIEGSSPADFLEMPLNIKTRKITKTKWEEHFKGDNDFSLPTSFGSNKLYSLYCEDSWEKDDYFAIKTEQMRLEEERRTIMEKRRKIEEEQRELEELEWQRYYSQAEGGRYIVNENKIKLSLDNNERTHREYRGGRYMQKCYESGVVPSNVKINDVETSHKEHNFEQPQQNILLLDKNRVDWKENTEKCHQKEDTTNKGTRKRKTRWQAEDRINIGQQLEMEEYQRLTLVHQDTSAINEVESDEKNKNSSDKQITEEEKGTPTMGNDGNKVLTVSESMTDNLNLQPMHILKHSKKSVQSSEEPHLLENEYEKFMQSLGSETNINVKTYKHRSKKQSSFNKDFHTISKDKWKCQSKSSSSSSSTISSNSSDSESSSGSSYTSTSSESNHFTKRKLKECNVKVKQEQTDAPQEKVMDVINTFDVGEKPELIIIKEEIESPHFMELSSSPEVQEENDLNIVDISLPHFSSLDEIPLPTTESSHYSSNSVFSEIPLPVPLPQVPSVLADASKDEVQCIEPSLSTVNENEAPNESFTLLDSLEIISSETTLTDTDTHSQTIKDDSDNKELSETDLTLSPIKRSHLIPLKFLTAELKKQVNDNSHSKLQNTLQDINKSVLEKDENLQSFPLTNRKRYFALSSINLPTKAADEFREDTNSADFTDKFNKRDERENDNSEEISSSFRNIEMHRERSVEKERTRTISPNYSSSRKRRNSISPYQRRNSSHNRRGSRSPRRYGSVRKRSRQISPRRKGRRSPSITRRSSLPRKGSPLLRRDSPIRSDSTIRRDSPLRKDSPLPGRRDSPPRRWHRNEVSKTNDRDRSLRRRQGSISPKRYSISPKRHSISPKRRSTSPKRRSISPRRRDRRSLSPRRRRSPRSSSLSRNHSPWRRQSKDCSFSKDRKFESNQGTPQKIDTDKYGTKCSPINSPVHGFRRSIADSTISDEQLMQHNTTEYADSPYNVTNYYKTATARSSPKRMSLDERINQALGITEEPKPISTTYSENFSYDQSYFDQYEQYYQQYDEQKSEINKYRQDRQRSMSNLKVVQVGNVLQVLPTDDAFQNQTPVQQNTVSNSGQRIIQVGNMLQILPTTSPEKPEPSVISTSTPSTSVVPVKEDLNAEALIKQKMARRVEKEKRRQERERKRKEKEKKRKERERKKQIKIKLQTEAMIKQALILETEDVPADNEEQAEDTHEAHMQWPPAPQIVFNNTSKLPEKGILCQNLGGNSSRSEKKHSEAGSSDRTKCVKFSDGVIPGEGTSPSGGEELSSPPPTLRKLPKEKRFKKTKVPKKAKVPKKKKVKVKVIRQQVQGSEDDDEDEQDNLPPPPPPPGSPPPHIFPARIKQPVINNTHPSMMVSLANSILQTTDVSYPPPTAYRPVMMPHPRGPPTHIPPPGLIHTNHPPPSCPPPPIHHGGFLPATVGMSPAHVIPPPVIPPIQPHHGGHLHHLHHQSPHHSHHLH